MPAAPSTTEVTLTHRFAVTPHEPACTSCSTPPALMPTRGARLEPQLSDAKKYSVADDSLPTFHRKWNPVSIAAEALTSAVTVADCLPVRMSSGSSTQLPVDVFAPPRRVREDPVQSAACTFRTVAAPRADPSAELGTVAPDAWVNRYSATSPSSGSAAWAVLTPMPMTMAPAAATATEALRARVNNLIFTLHQVTDRRRAGCYRSR